jgi:hypothetical protein
VEPSQAQASTDAALTVREPLTRSLYTRLVPRGFRSGGYLQAQYEHNQISEDQVTPDGKPINQDQYVLRRARLRLDHGWDYAAATLELDANSVEGLRVGVRRAEASLLYRGDGNDDATPLLVLTGGVTDIPFGSELGASPADRAFMERSIGSRALFPSEADLGVKLWGAYRFLNYAFALVNGEPQNGSGYSDDPNGDKDLVGRVGVDAAPSEDFQTTGGVSFYKGQGFHAGQSSTKGTLTWFDVDNDSVVDDGEVFGVTPSPAQPSENFERWALGLDLGLFFKTSFGLTSLEAEAFAATNLDRGLLRADPVGSGVDSRETGFSVGLTQEVTEHAVIGVRAAYYDPNSDLFEQRVGEYQPKKATFFVISPVVGLRVPHGKILAQYDLVQDYLARDQRGVPTDAENDQLTIRVQVDL